MSKFKILFNNAQEEEVEAHHYSDVKAWIVFYRAAGGSEYAPSYVEILRLKAAAIRRIELIEDDTSP